MPLRPANSSGEPPAPFAGTDAQRAYLQSEKMTQAELREAGLPYLACPFCQGGRTKGKNGKSREGCSRCDYTGLQELKAANARPSEEIEPAGNKQLAGGKK